MFLEEIANIKKFLKVHKLPIEQPNPRNHNGIILRNFEFQDMIQALIDIVITPISKQLWRDMGEDSLDHHNAFTVAYGE